jgi:hypothetical protein
MIVVLVFRPELLTEPPPYKKRSPFAGIEILGVFGNEDAANKEIDKHIDNGKGWEFHIDEAKPDLSVL